MRFILSMALLLGLQSSLVFAQTVKPEQEAVEDTAPLPDGTTVLDVMVVSGAQPGPGLRGPGPSACPGG